MTLFDRFRDAFKPERDHTALRLHGYRRLADQVYQVEVELADIVNPRARAILQAAKCLQVMADALLGDDSEVMSAKDLAGMTIQRAEKWYARIPDLLVGSRQEAQYPNSSQVALPVHIKDETYKPLSTWSDEHLTGLRRAVQSVAALLERRLSHPQFQAEKYKEVILIYQEARTRQAAGDAIVGLLSQGEQVSDPSRKEAESQYMSTLARYLLIAQGLEEPEVLGYEQIQVDFGPSGTRNEGYSEPQYTQSARSGYTSRESGYTSNGSGYASNGSRETAGGAHGMNFEQMQQQSNNVQQHNQAIVNQLQQIVAKVQQLDANDQNKQDISYALRELALSVRGLNQETMGLLQNMALYIQHLENSHQHAEHYQQQYPPQYQQQPRYGGGMFGGRAGGGFWDTLIRSAEIGAGFEIGADIVDDIFGGGF